MRTLLVTGCPTHEHRGTATTRMNDCLKPDDILTPEQLAERLQVSKTWVFEQTRQRAKVRNKHPLPCIRLGKYLRFSWLEVCRWMNENSD